MPEPEHSKADPYDIEVWFTAVKKEATHCGDSRTLDLKDFLIYYENGYTPERAYEESTITEF